MGGGHPAPGVGAVVGLFHGVSGVVGFQKIGLISLVYSYCYFPKKKPRVQGFDIERSRVLRGTIDFEICYNFVALSITKFNKNFMPGNTIGQQFTLTTFGESHGVALGGAWAAEILHRALVPLLDYSEIRG